MEHPARVTRQPRPYGRVLVSGVVSENNAWIDVRSLPDLIIRSLSIPRGARLLSRTLTSRWMSITYKSIGPVEVESWCQASSNYDGVGGEGGAGSHDAASHLA